MTRSQARPHDTDARRHASRSRPLLESVGEEPAVAELMAKIDQIARRGSGSRPRSQPPGPTQALARRGARGRDRRSIPATCLEKTVLTIDNGGTTSS